ncbi:MAG: ATP-binding cassette domain-containing protein [Acidimicrobiales bacterium]
MEAILEEPAELQTSSTDPVMPAVKVSKLVRRYGSVAAVDGIDLQVAKGEVYGFLGPNGAGKSTLIRMLCTLLHPTSGQAVVAGFDVVTNPQDVRLRIGVALQEAALDERQTGRELLKLQGRLYGLRPAEIRTRLDDVLDLVNIGSSIDRRVGTYSGGMKRRLDLAAALVHNPEILFLDEPTTGLDPASREAVWSEVRRLNHQLGMTIFLTTQYLEEADELADRVGFIAKGHLVAEGAPETLKRSIGQDLIVADLQVDESGAVVGDLASALDELDSLGLIGTISTEHSHLVLPTSDGPAALSPVALALGRARLQVKSLTLRTPTLDDVFRELTGSAIESKDESE